MKVAPTLSFVTRLRPLPLRRPRTTRALGSPGSDGALLAPRHPQAPAGGYEELIKLCEKHAVYDALVLPSRAKHGLRRLG